MKKSLIFKFIKYRIAAILIVAIVFYVFSCVATLSFEMGSTARKVTGIFLGITDFFFSMFWTATAFDNCK